MTTSALHRTLIIAVLLFSLSLLSSACYDAEGDPVAEDILEIESHVRTVDDNGPAAELEVLQPTATARAGTRLDLVMDGYPTAAEMDPRCVDMPQEGCCDDMQLNFCLGGVYYSYSCYDWYPQICGWDEDHDWFDCKVNDPVPEGIQCSCTEEPPGPDADPWGYRDLMCWAVDYEGCCHNGHLMFCGEGEDPELFIYDCSDYDPDVCGWDANKDWFDCTYDDEPPPEIVPECPYPRIAQWLVDNS